MNFLCHCSGIATTTQKYVTAARGHVRVLDTRKTLPGLRAIQRAAVRAGGGFNHRDSLSDAVLIKDNHIAAAGGVGAAVARAKGSVPHTVKVEVEVEDLAGLDEAIVVAGLPIAAAFFRALDAGARIETLAGEGARTEAGDILMRLAGNARALLTAERSALNAVQHLSGIATLTRHYVDAIAGTGAILLDTRKTLPGLRVLEKYATRTGGARNHRMRLDDAAMIKDNHVALAGGVGEAVRRAAAAGIARLIVEIDHLDQIEPAISAGATQLLLDNMGEAALREAVAVVGAAGAGRPETEASGGITLETIRAYAETGVDFISIGALTHSAPSLDLSLNLKAEGA